MPAPFRPTCVFGIGRNYPDHAAEMGGSVPQLVVFMKNPSAVIGSGDPIVIGSAMREHGPQVDYEGELGVVIGRDCRNVAPEEVLGKRGVVGGFCVANDVSARWWQKHGSGGQFCRGKSFDSFCPITAPVFAPSVGDPASLRLTTELNDDLVQSASVGSMSWSVAAIVAELSRDATLLAGTLILTGTPGGVGSAASPPRFLRGGDIVRVTIAGVGTLTNPVVESP